MPALAMASAITPGSAGSANCSGDTLTAQRTDFGQRARSLQAWRIAHSPIATISPASSATGTNFSGLIQPCLGWFQRISASNPLISSVAVLTTGW